VYVAACLVGERARVLKGRGREVGLQVLGGLLDVGGRDGRSYHLSVSDELDRVSPTESARVKARDKKVRGPKVIAVNPGLKKLAQHLADKRTKKGKG
jgi:hypothetical protein